jgi:hypothetical protein
MHALYCLGARREYRSGMTHRLKCLPVVRVSDPSFTSPHVGQTKYCRSTHVSGRTWRGAGLIATETYWGRRAGAPSEPAPVSGIWMKPHAQFRLAFSPHEQADDPHADFDMPARPVSERVRISFLQLYRKAYRFFRCAKFRRLYPHYPGVTMEESNGLAVHRRELRDGYCHRRLLPVCRRIDCARSIADRARLRRPRGDHSSGQLHLAIGRFTHPSQQRSKPYQTPSYDRAPAVHHSPQLSEVIGELAYRMLCGLIISMMPEACRHTPIMVT